MKANRNPYTSATRWGAVQTGRVLRAASLGPGVTAAGGGRLPPEAALTLGPGSSSGKVGNEHTHCPPHGGGFFFWGGCIVCLKQLTFLMWFCLLRLTIEPGWRFYSSVQNLTWLLSEYTWSWFLYSGRQQRRDSPCVSTQDVGLKTFVWAHVSARVLPHRAFCLVLGFQEPRPHQERQLYLNE